jgi:hypothetical protein
VEKWLFGDLLDVPESWVALVLSVLGVIGLGLIIFAE